VERKWEEREEGESEWERQQRWETGKVENSKGKEKKREKRQKNKTKKKETEWNGKGGKQESRVGKRKDMYYLLPSLS